MRVRKASTFLCRGPIGTRTPRTPDRRVHVFVSTVPNAEINGGEYKNELDLGRRAMRHVPISTREDHGQERERNRDSGTERPSIADLQLNSCTRAVVGPIEEGH